MRRSRSIAEEPGLARRYSPNYERYRRTIPGWIPWRRTGRVNDPQEFV